MSLVRIMQAQFPLLLGTVHRNTFIFDWVNQRPCCSQVLLMQKERKHHCKHPKIYPLYFVDVATACNLFFIFDFFLFSDTWTQLQPTSQTLAR